MSNGPHSRPWRDQRYAAADAARSLEAAFDEIESARTPDAMGQAKTPTGEDNMGIMTGMAIAATAGSALANIYGAKRSGDIQEKGLAAAQRNLERDRDERAKAWQGWQESQAPVIQARNDALMARLGRYRGPVGGRPYQPQQGTMAQVAQSPAPGATYGSQYESASVPNYYGGRGASDATGFRPGGLPMSRKRPSHSDMVRHLQQRQVPRQRAGGRMGGLVPQPRVAGEGYEIEEWA